MLHQQQFDELKTYWHDLQRENDGNVPRRRQSNPMRVPKLLPYVFLVERRSLDDTYVRLAGTAIEAAVGRSLTGVNYRDLYEENNWPYYITRTEALCAHPCGGMLDREVTFEDGKTMEVRSLNLPFADESGTVKYLLGVMAIRRAAYQQGIGEDNKVKVFRVREFDYIDLGYGTPSEDLGLTLMGEHGAKGAA